MTLGVHANRLYSGTMESVLPFLLVLAAFATLAVLVVGIISFAVSGRFYQRNANRLMRWRVVLQGVALAVFAMITFLSVSPPQW